MADYQDLFIERFKDDDPRFYEFKGQWEPAEVSTEVIQVAGGPSEEFEIISTRHGSIVAGDPAKGIALALRYTATAEPIKAFDSISRMLTATSVDEMDESMRDWVDPANNFVCVDVQGDIKYLTRGRLPIRPKANAWVPVPGWSGDYEWSGYVPFEEMPRSRNPESGFIVTANNRIADEDYPYYIGLDYDGEHRARCIYQALESLASATVEDMASVHALRTSIPARELCELLNDVEMRTDAAAEANACSIHGTGGWTETVRSQLFLAPSMMPSPRPIPRPSSGLWPKKWPVRRDGERRPGTGAQSRACTISSSRHPPPVR